LERKLQRVPGTGNNPKGKPELIRSKTRRTTLAYTGHSSTVCGGGGGGRYPGTVIWGKTGRGKKFKVILKIFRQCFLEFFFIKKNIINSTFHINAVFDGFGMRSTKFFLKCRLTGVTLA